MLFASRQLPNARSIVPNNAPFVNKFCGEFLIFLRQIIQRRHALTGGRNRQMQVALLCRLAAGGIADRADGIPNGNLIADIHRRDRLKIGVRAPQAVLPLGHNSRAIQIVIIHLVTVPDAMAETTVPYLASMSMPSCVRQSDMVSS